MTTTFDADALFASQPANIRWAESFARAFIELADGKADMHDLLDWAYELFPTRGPEDAAAVAREQFNEQA